MSRPLIFCFKKADRNCWNRNCHSYPDNRPKIYAVVPSLSHVWLFVTPWTAACQAFLSFTISQSLLKLISTESVMSSNPLILCRPLLLLTSVFPTSGSFPMSWLLTSGGQSIRTSAPVLPVNIRGWLPLGLTGLISLLSKGQREAWRATVHGVTESDTTEQLTHTSYIYNGVCNAVCLKLKLY